MKSDSEIDPRYAFFFQHAGIGKGNGFHTRKKCDPKGPNNPTPEELPVPGLEYLKKFGSVERYLTTGQRDANLMRDALIRAGVDPEKGPGNFLDFGCAHSRMLRWFVDWAMHGEAWGVDLNSAMIFWGDQHLSPPFNFAVSTSIPRLHFESRFFDLIYATSVFTQIDDMYLSWICEFRRILKPGALLYFSFFDEVTTKIQKKFEHGPYKQREKSKAFLESLEAASSFCAANRNRNTLTSFRRNYLIDHLENYFDVVEIVDRAVSLSETALLLRKK